MNQSFQRSLLIPRVGKPTLASPGLLKDWGLSTKGWGSDADRILLNDELHVGGGLIPQSELVSIERAGPRRNIFFPPEATTCAIVTCGGLCPGINDVIRSLVMHAHYGYGIRRILGLRYGYEGLNPRFGHEIMDLTPEAVSKIQHLGGSILGVSRGKQDAAVMADHLEHLDVQVLFVVGGDGSQRGAHAIYEEISRRGARIAVVGIPKTIDNDLLYMDRSFGYLSAFSEAVRSLEAAHSEARCARNGIGLVKLMGRDSGFIACAAALATAEANFVLIPEVPFQLDGKAGLLECLESRLHQRGHALIVVAEGAGQELLPTRPTDTDASGNRRYGDIGTFLRDSIRDRLGTCSKELNVKYIDPSYQLRGIVATPEDRIFCHQLARHAVHAALAGKTGMVVALWHQRFVHLPMYLVTAGRRKVDVDGDLWRSVLESTGQPTRMA